MTVDGGQVCRLLFLRLLSNHHLRDLAHIVISMPGHHVVLVPGPARSKRSSQARSYAKGGGSCVYSRKLCGRPPM